MIVLENGAPANYAAKVTTLPDSSPDPFRYGGSLLSGRLGTLTFDSHFFIP